MPFYYFPIMIIVIADDITGAAEIAGIALKHGCDTLLTTNCVMPDNKPDVLVFATDTRSMVEKEACGTVREITKNIRRNEDVTVFKKTDSVLRGHVVSEIDAIIETLNYDNAILLPQNPSKGRIIKNGTYYIGGQLLSDTDFNKDPEFPAVSADVMQLLDNEVVHLSLNGTTANHDKNIFIADAENDKEIGIQLEKASEHTLLAGGADFFTSLLRIKYNKTVGQEKHEHPDFGGRTVIICGSTQSKDISKEPFIRQMKAVETIMPDDVFEGSPADNWIREIKRIYEKNTSVIIKIGNKRNGGKDYAIRLKSVMADMVLSIVKQASPNLLIIEGGATAYSILNRMNWNLFKLKKEYAPGVVGMTYECTEIILKPGSYSWGGIFNVNSTK